MVTQSIVDYVNGGVDEMVDDAPGEREVDETDESSLRGGGVHRHLSSGGGGGDVWRISVRQRDTQGLLIIKFHGKVRDSDFQN